MTLTSAPKSCAWRCCSPVAGNDPYAAVQAFLDPLQRTISCVTRTRVNVFSADIAGGSPYHPADAPHRLVLGEGAPVRLHVMPGEARIALAVRMRYSIVPVPADPSAGPWNVRVDAYDYALYDEGGREIFAYHYHPTGRSRVTAPHLHLRAAHVTRSDLAEAHFPTGHIPLTEILRMLLDEAHATFGVRPLHRNWRAVLQEGQSAFERSRIWSDPGARPPA